MRFSQGRIELDRSTTRRHGLGKMPQRREDRAQIAVVFGRPRIIRNGAPDQVNCRIGMSGLMRDHAEKMQCGGMRRPRGEDLAAQRFGFSQPAVAVVRQRKLQRLLDRHRRHFRDLRQS